MKIKHLAVLGAAILLTAFSARAVTYPWFGPAIPVNSLNGCATNGNLATNLVSGGLALYPATIGSNAVIVTNLTLLNGGGSGNNLSIQFQGAEGSGGPATNVTFVLTSTGANDTIAPTNSTAYGYAGSALPRSIYCSPQLILVTGGAQTTTNVILTPNTTPPFHNGVKVYLEQINNGAGTEVFTNYQIIVTQN